MPIKKSDRDRLLNGISKAADELLTNRDLDEAILNVLKILGEAALADRVSIFENVRGENEPAFKLRFEWPSKINYDTGKSGLMSYNIFPTFYETLSENRLFLKNTKELQSGYRKQMEEFGTQSIISLPIYISNEFWGGLNFSYFHADHNWTEYEKSILQTGAAIIGSAIIRKKSEETARETEELYRQMVEDASDIIYRSDYKGYFTYVNPVTARIMRMSANDIIGRHFTELINPEYRKKAFDFYQEQFSKRTPFTYFEFPAINTRGEDIWVGQNVKLLCENDRVAGFHAVARDITDRKNAEEKIKLSEEKFRSIIENMQLGLVELDEYDNVIDAHERFCEMTGYSQEELKGKNTLMLFTGEKYKSKVSLQNIRKIAGLKSVFEIQVKRKNGEVIWVLISETPLQDKDRNIIGSIGIYLDITERKNAEQELIRAKELAEHSKKAEEQFLANMSHEIRTPMNAIVGLTDILMDASLSPGQKECVSAIKISAGNLLAVINDILDFSKIESGKVIIESAPFELDDLLNGIVQTLHFTANNKNISLSYSIDENIPPVLLGDTVRLRQILLNLSGNSIKFTEKGEVKIQAALQEIDEDQYVVIFSVVDTGIGIPEDKQSAIFDSFTQASGDTTRKYGGTGLGLTIAKELIGLMNGSIFVKSKVNEGSTFYVTIPFKKGDTLTDVNEKKKQAFTYQELSGTRVLLVEDNVMNQFLAKKILQSWNFQIDVADNGNIAIEKIRQADFDIILMDIQMPEKDGFETTDYIRKQMPAPKSSLPIIAITAHALIGEAEKCIAAGMNDYVSKPFNKTVLYEKINKLVDGSVVKAKLKNTNQHIDLAYLEKTVEGNIKFMTDVINLFLQQMPDMLDEMNQNCEQKEWDKLRATAHKVRPSIELMGIHSTKEILLEIEKLAIEKKSLDLLSGMVKQVNTTCYAAMEELKMELKKIS